jgi:iron complex transport system substrate-binding protein
MYQSRLVTGGTFARLHKLVALALSVVLVASLALVGCSGSAASAGSSQAAVSDPSAASSSASTTDPMADRTVTDDAGRSVTVPGVGALSKIYYTGATGEIFCFTLAPELAGGTTYQWTQAELSMLPPAMATLPYLGTTSGGKQLNPEAIVQAGIQLIVSVATDKPTATDATSADDLQQQTGIPVVVYSGAFDDMANTYTELGALLGREEQAKQLADYCTSTLASVKAAVAQVPSDQRVSVYYAEGPDGLSTEPDSSSHALAFQIAGADNVAASVEAAGGKGMSPVSLEQVLAWNPQVIIAWSTEVRGGASDTIPTDPDWSTVSAVQNGRVYTMPNVPFAWCDRPPAVNRILGIEWLANILYPSYYNVDMVQQTEQFYSLFYHVDLTDDQAKDLLGNSYPATAN